MHTTFGRHLLAEYCGCAPRILNDSETVARLMNEAASAARVGVVQCVVQKFEPQGVSVVLVLEESHMSIHTWPESGYAAVDFYTCGASDPRLAHEVLLEGLGADSCELALIHRGMRTEDRSMQKVAICDDDAPDCDIFVQREN